MQKIILASKSKNRQKLLQALGVPFKVVVSDFNEKRVKETNFKARAAKIALAKAEKVAVRNKEIIIACDTFTVCRGQILEKPTNLNEAKQMLKKLSGNKAVCYTGFCFINKKKQTRFVKTAATELVFRKIDEEELSEYVNKFPVTSWAAAYAAPQKSHPLGCPSLSSYLSIIITKKRELNLKLLKD